MNRRQLRNAALYGVAALSASLEAPRLRQSSLGVAAAELTSVPTALASSVKEVADNINGTYLGFDTNLYPGNKAMAAWRESGEYSWVGYYLPAPCHKDDSWSGKRETLVDQGWGLAVIYVGQQTWSGKRVRTRGNTTCSRAFVTASRGRIDAKDAVRRTAREGFPEGTVIFLDVEYMDKLSSSMRSYYKAWASAVLADGRYKPGFYAHTHNATAIYKDVKQVYASHDVTSDPPFWIAGQGDFVPDPDAPPDPSGVGHVFADVWQGMLDVVRTHNGVRLPIDISSASVASPSVPVN
jgi:hypothetical protein